MTRDLDYVRRLRDLGLSVFPIPYGSKIPTLSWKPLQDRLATDDELRDWFPAGQPMNLGIVTGAISRLVVLDADTEAALAYVAECTPHTPWWTQTARGRHAYFTHPGGHVTNRGTDLVHVRGDGGYVLGDGSLHPSGARYHSSVGAPRPPLPLYDPAWLPPVPAVTRPQGRMTRENLNVFTVAPPTGQATENRLLLRARRYLEAIPPPVIGQGSDTQTLKVACRLVRGLEVDPVDAEQLLWAWAGGRPGWTRDWITRKVAHAAMYGKEPIGGLR